MYCTNCGKEVDEAVRFCPECGAPVIKEAKDTSKEKNQPQGDYRIYVTGDPGQLWQSMEKSGKFKKKVELVITLLLAVYGFLMVRGLLRMMAETLEGRESAMNFAISTTAIILLTCGILNAALEVMLPILEGRKAIRTEEYFKYIAVNDARALMHSLGQMQCSAVKSAYMDERGIVCVDGRKSKHTFTIEDGAVVMTSRKSNYKAVLERETIAACLLKFLAPEAPVNAYENEKRNVRLSRMKLLLAVISILTGMVMIAIVFVFGMGNAYVNMVTGGSPELYPDITYGEAFDAFFDDCEWKYFASTDGKDVVEFHGDCLYGDEKATIVMQFVVNMDAGTFEVYAASIDGEEQAPLVYSALLLKVFESYKGDGEMGKLQPGNLGGTASLSAQQSDTDTRMEDTPAENPPAAEETTTPIGPYDEPDYAYDYNDNIGQDPAAELSGNYTDYQEWGGVYDGGWMDTSLTLSLYSDGTQDLECGNITTNFRGNETFGNLYYLGENAFLWEAEYAASVETYYIYAVYDSGTYQLELYDSDGTYDVTFTQYEQYMP